MGNVNTGALLNIFKSHDPLFKPPLLSRLPKPISRFLGYRDGDVKPPPSWARYVSIFIGCFGAMLANLAVAEHSPLYINYWHYDTMSPSFAASCILIYGAINVPLAQPRNLLFGHMLSGIIGIGITKLFMIRPANEKYLWISASLSVACSAIATEYTGVVHPPAGATAALPSLNEPIRKIGWNFLPSLLIHICLFLGIALFINNIFRRYPVYWLFPNTPQAQPQPQPQLVVSPSAVKCPNNVTLTDEEINVIHGIQKRMK